MQNGCAEFKIDGDSFHDSRSQYTRMGAAFLCVLKDIRDCDKTCSEVDIIRAYSLPVCE